MSRLIFIAALVLSACSSNNNATTSTGAGAGSASSGATAGTDNGSGTGTGGASTGSAAGSGSATSGSTTGVANGPALAAFIKSYSTDLCDFNFGCGAKANYYYTLCSSYSAPGYSQIAAAVDAGRIGYAPDKAQECLDTFPNAPCYGFPPDQSTACQEVFRGLVVPGQPCNSTADCSGGFCNGDGGCDGTCVQYAEIGDTCSDTVLCNPTEFLTCVSGTCKGFQQIQQRCGPGYPECGPPTDLDCIGGVCLPIPSALMKSCEFGKGECAAGGYCFQKAGATKGTCLEQIALKGACAEDTDHFQNAFSATDFECSEGFQIVQCVGAGTLLDGGIASGTCQSTSGETDPCPIVSPDIDLTQPFNSGCLQGLDCLGEQCLRPHGAGVACYPPPVLCDPTKAYCEVDSDGGGMCVTLIKQGDPCTDSDQCGAFNICNDAGVCELPTGPLCSPAF